MAYDISVFAKKKHYSRACLTVMLGKGRYGGLSHPVSAFSRQSGLAVFGIQQKLGSLFIPPPELFDAA